MTATSRLTSELIDLVEAGPGRARVAAKLDKSRDWLDKIARGDSNILLKDAEQVAASVGGSLQFVRPGDAAREFRRALLANTDLSSHWHRVIWSAFQQAKADALGGQDRREKPTLKKVKAGPSR